MNLNLLRSFLAVAEAGSVSRAAEKAFISQPALSKAVKQLEKEVGLPLMERVPRGVVLTEAGQNLMQHARALFALERTAEEMLLAYGGLQAGTLRIGASATPATYVLPEFLGRFRRAHPHVTLNLRRSNTHEIEAALLAFELDVAIVEGVPHETSLLKTPWREDELVCIAAPDHPLADRESVWPDELRGEPWIVRESGSGTREIIERALAPFGLPPSDALEIGSPEAIKQAVAAGLGIAVVSKAAAADQLALGKLRVLRLAEVEMRRSFWLLHLPGRIATPAARAFEALLRQENGVRPV